jgi:hypothetical protein
MRENRNGNRKEKEENPLMGHTFTFRPTSPIPSRSRPISSPFSAWGHLVGSIFYPIPNSSVNQNPCGSRGIGAPTHLADPFQPLTHGSPCLAPPLTSDQQRVSPDRNKLRRRSRNRLRRSRSPNRTLTRRRDRGLGPTRSWSSGLYKCRAPQTPACAGKQTKWERTSW